MTRRPRSEQLRYAALAVWVAGLVLYCVFIGLPLDKGGLILWIGLGLMATSIGRGRRAGLVVLDFLPLGLVLVGYDFLRGAADTLGMPTHWHFPLEIDKALFFGHVPTVWLQEHLRYQHVQWWEIPVALCYISYFALATITAGVLWLRSRRDFYRWIARFVPLCLLAFTVFALVPTAPPWAAARCSAAQVASQPSHPACMFQPPALTNGGLLGAFQHVHAGVHPYVQRISPRGLKLMHLTRADSLLRSGQHTVDLVAAVPSLHSAGVLLFVIFMWRRVRWWWRPLLALYPLAMTFTLVYTGEHYVSDVLFGWLAAVLVSVAAIVVERRLAARTKRDSADEGIPQPAPVAVGTVSE